MNCYASSVGDTNYRKTHTGPIIKKIMAAIMAVLLLSCIMPAPLVSAIVMEPTLSIDDITVEEGYIATFTVSLSSSSSNTVTVDYTTSSGSATAGSDYSSTSGTLTFAPGETMKFIEVHALEDSIDEHDETYNLTLSNPTNAIISDGDGLGTILDNDAPPALAINDQMSSEGFIASFIVSLLNASEKTITVNYYTGDGTAAAGSDYVASTGTITFAPGETIKTAEVHALEDSIDEYDETYNVNLSNPTNATISDGVGVGTIGDNDPPPEISINDVTVTEGNTASFTLTLSSPSGKTVTVDYSTYDGTAMAGFDFSSSSGTMTFNPGETSKTVDVYTTQDSLDEFSETFNVELVNPDNATILNGTGVGTILDDDNAPTISINDTNASEGNNAVFTVSLSTASSKAITVDFSTYGNTAADGLDFVITNGTITFAPSETSKTILISTLDDTLDEYDETFNVELVNPNNATINDGMGVGTIVDDDASPQISISGDTHEEGNDIVFTVTLSAPSARDVTVDYATAGSTATEGSDYTGTSGTLLTFTAGDTSKTITVSTSDDSLDENEETFYVNLSNPNNATLGDNRGVGTIIDNDVSPSISIDDASTPEGNTAMFTVSLSDPSGRQITVNYQTVDGTASDGFDYTGENTTLTFYAGETSKAVAVTTTSDTVYEGDETFTVELSTPVNSFILDGSGQGTILDDDNVPQISIDDVTVSEGDPANFTVSLSNASAQSITVEYAASDGTATTPNDYTAVSGTLTFNPGEVSHNVDVPTTEDTLHEPTKTFTVNLGTPTNATISDSTGIATIADDDPAINTITYDPNGGSGTASQSDDNGDTVTLHSGSTFTRAGYVIEGWAESSAATTADYMLGDLYKLIADKTLYAFWAQDTDGDGVSDADEIAAGTSPNNKNDVPKDITVKIVVLDLSGNPLSNETIVINSIPQTATTDASGGVTFYGVGASSHTLSFRRNNQQLGTYTLDFTRSGTNSTAITDDASTDSEGRIATGVANNFESIEITIQLNRLSQWQLMNSTISYRADNPPTGDKTYSALLYLAVCIVALAAAYYIWVKKRNKCCN